MVLSEEDFRRANVEASRTVNILAFVEHGQIPQQIQDRGKAGQTEEITKPARGGMEKAAGTEVIDLMSLPNKSGAANA